MTAPVTVNRERVRDVAGDILALLEASGLTPIEGLMAVESLYALLLLRGMDAAQGHQATVNAAKELALRSLDRMSSRVLSWPARTEDAS